MEFYLVTSPKPGLVVDQARQTEDSGWDGLSFSDSQNLTGCPYVAIALAAQATTTLKFTTSVTNSWTRHPAVTATSIASVRHESGGRASLGIGRGDSALARIGMAPVSPSQFRTYLEMLQAYLRGDSVPFQLAAKGAEHLLGENLPLGDAPVDSRIEWFAEQDTLARFGKVPVSVAASGPKMLAIAAEHGDRVTLAVGADPDRVRWAIGLAREARADVPVDAFVNVVVDEDRARGVRLAAAMMALHARFSTMHGTSTGPMTDEQRRVIEGVPAVYDMNKHSHLGSAQSKQMTPEFAERFAIVGPAGYCVERLKELAEIGVENFVVFQPTRDDPEAARRYEARLTDDVLPGARR